MITIENLKHLVAAVENQGVLRAGEKIFLSASSITRSIQQIEAELGYSIFDRVSRNMTLNQAGRHFYEKAVALLEKYSSLLNENVLTGELTGHYRIGASHFLCQSFLGNLIAGFCRRFRRATFEIYSFDSHMLVKKLHVGEIDLGFSFSPKASPVVEQEKIYQGQLRLCAAKTHPLINQPFSRLKRELSRYPAIVHRPSESVERCDNHPIFGKFGIKPSVSVYWDSDFFALGLLAKTDFWSLLPDYILRSQSDVVAFKHPKAWNAPYRIDLLWNRRKSESELRDVALRACRENHLFA